MSRSVRRLVFGVAVCVSAMSAIPVHAQAPTPLPPLPSDSTARARMFVGWFIAGNADSLWANAVQGGNGMLRSRETLAGVVSQLVDGIQIPGTVVEEKWIWRNGGRQFWHARNVSGLPEPLVLRVIVTVDGKLGGFGGSPLSVAPPVDSAGPVLPRP